MLHGSTGVGSFDKGSIDGIQNVIKLTHLTSLEPEAQIRFMKCVDIHFKLPYEHF